MEPNLKALDILTELVDLASDGDKLRDDQIHVPIVASEIAHSLISSRSDAIGGSIHALDPKLRSSLERLIRKIEVGKLLKSHYGSDWARLPDTPKLDSSTWALVIALLFLCAEDYRAESTSFSQEDAGLVLKCLNSALTALDLSADPSICGEPIPFREELEQLADQALASVMVAE